MLPQSKPQDVPQSLATRDKIQQLQQSMVDLRCDMPEAEHFYAPGTYGRKFTMPAGMLVVGKIHKHSHLMMVLKGRAQVITEFDNTIVEAGYVGVSQPGAKRVVYAFEETTFMTIHHNPTNSEDLEEFEANHIIDEGFLPEYHLDHKKVLS